MPTLVTTLLLFLNLAIAACMATSVALLCSCFVKHLPRKHAVLVAGLLACLLATLVVALGATVPLGQLPGLADQETPRANEVVLADQPDVLLPSSDFPSSNSSGSVIPSENVSAPVGLGKADVDATGGPVVELAVPLPEAASEHAEVSGSVFRELPYAIIAGVGLLVGWLAGTLYFAACRVRDLVRARRMLAACRVNQEASLRQTFHSVCQRLGIRKVPRLLISHQVSSPIVVGFVEPKVILPATLRETFSEQQIAAMMMHELGHVARRDQWVVALQMITTTLYWWNPLVWMSSAKIAQTRELICDDVVLNLQTSPRDYAWSLVTMAEQLVTTEKNMASIGISQASGGELERRIRRLLAGRAGYVPTHLSTRSLIGCLAFGAGLISAMVLAQVPPLGAVAAATVLPDQQGDQPASENKTEPERVGNSNFPQRKIAGIVVDSSGNAVAGARVEIKGRVMVAQETDAAGRFDFRVRISNRNLQSTFIIAEDSQGETKGFHRFNPHAADFQIDNLRIRLEESRLAEVVVVDDQDNPIQDAKVAFEFESPVRMDDWNTDANGRVVAKIPASEKIEAVVAWKDQEGLDYRLFTLSRGQQSDVNSREPRFPEGESERLVLSGTSPVTVRAVDINNQPIAGLIVYPWLLRKAGETGRLNLGTVSYQFKSVTNDEGVATFDWMPAWQRDQVTFGQLSEEFERTRANYSPVADGGQLELRLRRLVSIRGRVVDNTGSPQEGIEIRASGTGYSPDDFMSFAATDANGEYEIQAAVNKLYLVTIVDDNWAANAQTGFAVYPDQPIDNLDFVLRKGTKLYGRLVNETTGEPIANSVVTAMQKGSLLDQSPDVEIPNPEDSTKRIQPTVPRWTETNSEGEYEFILGDGSYSIRAGGAAKEVTIAGEPSIEMNLAVKTEEKQRLLGLVVQKQDGAPVRNAELFASPEGSILRNWQAKTDRAGNFLVMREPADTVVRAYGPDGKLAGFAELDADDNNVILELEPVGQASGRILSNEGQAIIGKKLRLLRKTTFGWHFNNSEPSNSEPVYTDEQGRFQLANLIPGYRYQVRLEEALGKSELCFEFTAESGKATDLGVAEVPPRGIEPLFPD